MNVDAVAKRASSLPKSFLDVLACMSDGMSNHQIAIALGYKNARSVASTIHHLNKRLGLNEVHSTTEKRRLAADAFKICNGEIFIIRVPLRPEDIDSKTITFSRQVSGQMKSLLKRRYRIEAVEVTFRKESPAVASGAKSMTLIL